ncbi:MAG: HAMP domain-containing histidine kinase [Endomicrobium sp.]|nr:HAMP domain-containing histidine kinase [Endomicrobium sp.]
MATDRLVKWSKESKDFFKLSTDNSIVLDVFISYLCASQTGEGFEELVNTINSPDIQRKVKKVIITDTSYLNRHTIPKFVEYCDSNAPTEWYLKNKEAIEKLTVPTELKSWANEIRGESFNRWKKQIMIEYKGDENGHGIVQDFRDLVIAEAAVAAYKNKKEIKDCVNVMIEECAQACATFNGTINLVYPMKIPLPLINLAERYNLNINHLVYRASVQTQNSSDHVSIDFDGIDKEIALFMKEKVSNVNFYVIDKYGNHIFKNSVYDERIGDVNFARLDPVSWKNSINVMNKREQIIIEEEFQGTTYLSVKAPLIINDTVKGVIGLAVDITEKKKAEELEKKLAIQIELYEIAKGVAHDICSPLSALEMVKYMSLDKLSPEERKMFELSLRSIKDIAERLVSKYRSTQKEEWARKNKKDKKDKEDKEEENEPTKSKEQDYIGLYGMRDLVDTKKYQYHNKKEIDITFLPDDNNKFVFIKGDFTNFSRMMSNLINNAVEAIEGRGGEGEVEVLYKVKGEEVEVLVKDNGEGMPSGMVEKINRGMAVGTTKENGNGIGMEQILGTVKELEGKMEVKSKEGEGTEFRLRFKKVESPKWFADKIEIRKGSTVVVLDDDVLVHDIWKKKFKEYEKEMTVKYFTQGIEAMTCINSIEDKSRIFLITDYKLKKQDINGIVLIEKTNMYDKHILVTSQYLSEMKEFNEKIRTFNKMYINDIPLLLV